MDSNPDTVDKVVRFVAREARVDPGVLSLSMSLLEDLGIDGDDAIDFFNAFAEEFGVNLSGFDPKKYFGPEGLGATTIFARLLSLLLGRIHDEPKIIPIYISDLVQAAEKKIWPKEMIDNSSTETPTHRSQD